MNSIIKRTKENLSNLSQEFISGIQKHFVKIHLEHQKKFLETKLHDSSIMVKMVCKESLRNLELSEKMLINVLNGFKIEIVQNINNSSSQIIAKDILNMQNLLNMNSFMAKYTYSFMLFNYLNKKGDYEQAYKQAVINLLKKIGSIEKLAINLKGALKESGKAEQCTAAMSLDFLRYLSEYYVLKIVD